MQDKILARLQKGESAEDIAKEFSDALNAAEAEFNSVSKEKEHKRYLVHQIVVPVKEYIETYFSDNAKLIKSMKDFGSTDEEICLMLFCHYLMVRLKLAQKDLMTFLALFSEDFSKNSKM